MEMLKNLQKKSTRLERLCAELTDIQKAEKEFEYALENIDTDNPCYFFGFKFGSGICTTSFALNGITKYTDLTRNIIALTKVELDRRKLEIMDELERDFGGIE
ncbi:hypothetical protein [Enterococcus pallens]|uniref:Uncharacterized protein n=1 Tax=Enterococcus pallens ATCC BAA-351 TaxID=1158607 RepID=R2T3H1_9ENTE|nr:hypothetical protein [Enterococcus pallens]EOH94794.1 hypothetical protein UAU_01716 [Enterococcus pallens ATCC BAA-351]EOU14887.1 hypothetical protein I588_04537 [Enterococcus pallens ATCC BAA-351]OJG78149.1 hypothetical protein RV10_GL001637 [Enterococcus pallens]